MAAMPHGSIERMKDTTEALTAWLEQVLSIVIRMKTNGVAHHNHQLKYIDEKYIVH